MPGPTWNWGHLEMPGDREQSIVEDEMAAYLVDFMIHSRLTELMGPDGTRYEIDVTVAITPKLVEVAHAGHPGP